MHLVIKKNRLILNEMLFLQTAADIESFLLLKEDNLVVVLLNPLQLQDDRNIFCYDFDKELKWQISDIEKLHANNYYISIYLSKENNLNAYNLNGVEVTIDRYTGHILKKELIK